MEEKKPLIIVISHNYFPALGAIRSLGAAGYTVDLMSVASEKGGFEVAKSSKYVRNSEEIIIGNDDANVIEALLKYSENCDGKVVLFPADEYSTLLLDRNRSKLDSFVVMPYAADGSDDCISDCMEKSMWEKAAEKAGFKIGKEWEMSLDDELTFKDEISYPCFCELIPAEDEKEIKAKKSYKCADEEALEKRLEKMREEYPGESVFIHERIAGEKEFTLCGVCINQKVVVPALIKRYNIAKFKKGVTLAGEVVSVDKLDNAKEKIIDMLRQFNYTGLFDMVLVERENEVYLKRISFRNSGLTYAYFMNGVNLPAILVSEALGEECCHNEEMHEFNKVFINEKALWEDYLHGYMKKKEFEDRLAATENTLLDCKTDPAPGKLFIKQNKKKLRKKKRKAKIKKLKKQIKKMLRPVIKALRPVKHFVVGYPQTKKSNRRNPFSETPRVVVSGRNYCSNLCMARSFGQAGYEVEVLRIFHVRPKLINLLARLNPEAYSKYVKAYHSCVYGRKSKNVVKKLIQIADPYRKMLLIPTDDLVANIADKFYNELSQYYLIPNVEKTEGNISRLMSKGIQKDLARAAGLPVAGSCIIRTVNKEFEIPEEITYPCFIKPNISKDGSKSRMQKCESKEELENAIKELTVRKDVELLVEEYLDINKEFAILGLSTKDGVVAPGYFSTEEGGHDGQRGTTMTGQVVPCAEEQELIDNIKKFVSSLQYEGLFDVDLIQTTDGKMYFVELNLRYGGSGYAITKSGVNLPGMFADYMFKGTPIDKNCSIDYAGRSFLNEKVMLGEYVNGYLKMSDIKKYTKDSDIHFIADKEDPKPYNYFRKIYYVLFFGKLLLKIKRKIK